MFDEVSCHASTGIYELEPHDLIVSLEADSDTCVWPSELDAIAEQVVDDDADS